MRRLDGRVVLAGSDLANGWAGFIDGAIESGLRAGQRAVGAQRLSAAGLGRGHQRALGQPGLERVGQLLVLGRPQLLGEQIRKLHGLHPQPASQPAQLLALAPGALLLGQRRPQRRAGQRRARVLARLAQLGGVGRAGSAPGRAR